MVVVYCAATDDMKAILAEGFHETNSLDKAKWGDAQGSGLKGNYANETAKWLVTQYLIWAAEKNYITKHSNTSWTWKSQVEYRPRNRCQKCIQPYGCKELLR